MTSTTLPPFFRLLMIFQILFVLSKIIYSEVFMKKLIAAILLLTVIFSLLGGCAVTRINYAFECGDVYGSILSEMFKISKTDKIPLTPDTKVNFRIGKNDVASAHVWLRNDKSDIEELKCTVSEFKSESGNTLKQGSVKVQKEYFHPIKEVSGTVYLPDGLIPLTDFTNNVTVKKGENCAYWIDAEVDESTASDVYKGNVLFSFKGGKISVPVEIKVEEIVIPEVASVESFGAIFAPLHHEYPDLPPEEVEKLHQDMVEFLLGYRITPSKLYKKLSDFSTPEEYADYVADSLESEPRITATELYNIYEIDDIKRVSDRLEERGVIDKCFIYCYDEPTKDKIPEILWFLDRVKEVAPNLRNLICTAFYPEFIGKLNFWCCTPSGVTKHPELAEQIKASGASFWQYGHSAGGAINNNLGAVNAAELASIHRLELDGYLQWSIYHSGLYDSLNNKYISWNRDMWNETYCFLPVEFFGNADGATYFYPGKVGDGIVNENRICESIRVRYLELGAETYELLEIRENQLKRAIVKQGLEGKVDVKDLMSPYYDIFELGINRSAKTYDDKVIQNYEYVLDLLYDDILSFNEDETLFSITRYEEESYFKFRDVCVYAPKGKNITVNSQKTECREITENICEYKTTITCEGAEQTFTINIDNEKISRKVFAKTVDKKNSASIFDGGKITEEDYNLIKKVSPKDTVLEFRNDEIALDLTKNAVKIPFSGVGNIQAADKENATHIAISMRNDTSTFILAMRMMLHTSRSHYDFDLNLNLDPGRAITYYVPLEQMKAAGFKLSQVTYLRLGNSDRYVSSDLRVSLSDISFVKIEDSAFKKKKTVRLFSLSFLEVFFYV